MLKEIKEVGGEAGNDSTMEAKAEEGFQRSSTGAGGPRGERSENGLTMSPLPLSTFFSESSGVSIAANQQGVWGFDFVFLQQG